MRLDWELHDWKVLDVDTVSRFQPVINKTDSGIVTGAFTLLSISFGPHKMSVSFLQNDCIAVYTEKTRRDAYASVLSLLI